LAQQIFTQKNENTEGSGGNQKVKKGGVTKKKGEGETQMQKWNFCLTLTKKKSRKKEGKITREKTTRKGGEHRVRGAKVSLVVPRKKILL